MASPCSGTGIVGGKFCPQCNGDPFRNPDCAEYRRRNQGQEVLKIWESPPFFTGSTQRVIKHPMNRVPAHIDVSWESTPYYKPAMAGGPMMSAQHTLTIVRRDAAELEYKLDHAAGAEPGAYRLIVHG